MVSNLDVIAKALKEKRKITYRRLFIDVNYRNYQQTFALL
jgi:hypothetical protein